MNIEIYVKDGKALATNESGGARVIVNVDVDKILNEIEVQSDGKKHGTLYINRHNNAQWCEEKTNEHA